MKSLITLILLAFSTFTFAQTWNTFTNHKEVRKIVKENNFLWVATGGGLLKWDLDTEQYQKITTSDGLIGNDIRDLAIDDKGNKWLATSHGIVQITSDEQIINFTKSDGLETNEISAVAIDEEGNKWFGTNEQYSPVLIIKLDNDGNFSHEIVTSAGSLPGVYNITVDKQNRVVLSVYGRIYRREASGEWVKYVEQTDPQHGTFQDMTFDADGVLWAVSAFGLYSYDGDGNQTTHDVSGSLLGYPYSIIIDEQSTKWIGTKEGIFSYDINEETTFTEVDRVILTLEGEGDNFWLGTVNDMYSFNGLSSELKVMKTKTGLISNQVTDIDIDEESSVWMATSAGISVLDSDSKWKSYDLENGLPCNSAYKIISGADKKVYVGHLSACNDLSIIDKESEVISTLSFDSLSFVLSMNKDADNNIWIGNYIAGHIDQASAVRVEPNGNYKYFHFSDSGIDVAPNDKTTNISFDANGETYFTARSGVYKISSSDEIELYQPNNSYYSSTAILVDSEENSWLAKGDYFAGTQKLIKTPLGEDNITIAHPELDNQHIYQIVEDEDQHIWIASTNGLFEIDADNTVIRHTTLNGLADNHVTDIVIRPNGDMWISSINGVSTTSTTVSAVKPKTIVSKLKIFPNPSSGLYYIDHTGNYQASSITVTNQLGQVVLVSSTSSFENSSTLDLQHLSAGSYYVQMITENGIFIAKILKL